MPGHRGAVFQAHRAAVFQAHRAAMAREHRRARFPRRRGARVTDVAAFDFDGTLTNGGSVFAFLSALRGHREVLRVTAAMAPMLARAAVVGGTAADQTKELLFTRLLAGVTAEELHEASGRFALAHVRRHLRHDVRSQFDRHRRRGDRTVIVSASPECYVQVAGEWLGADAVLATRLAVGPDGTLTGRYDGANCRGTEKLRRLQDWTAASGAGGQLWAYGNSRGDLRMLTAADVGVNVGRLGQAGRLRGFHRLSDVADLDRGH